MGTLFRRSGRSGHELPQPIIPTTLERRGPSRYVSYGEGDDASEKVATPIRGIALIVLIPLLWIVAIAAYAAGRV